jgi:hypothetical protein
MIATLFCGPLAQSVEQWTFNPLVEGSNPSRPTILNSFNDIDCPEWLPRLVTENERGNWLPRMNYQD